MDDNRRQPLNSVGRLLLAPAFAYGATIVLALAIAVATLMPPGLVQPPGSDKLHHLLGFAALAFPVALARPRRLVVALPAFLAFGAAIELVQPYFGRSAEAADLIADAAGIMIGTGLGLFVRGAITRNVSRHPIR